MVHAGNALILLAGATACTPEPFLPWSAQELEIIFSLSPEGYFERGNSQPSPVLAAFGKELFFDVRLSKNGQVACATCHQPSAYFTDGRARAFGIALGTRHTPSLIGAATLPFLTWDGRHDSLWSQALEPLEEPSEQGLSRLEVVAHICKSHSQAYEEAFGALPDMSDRQRFPRQGGPMLPENTRGHEAWQSMHLNDRDQVNQVFANVGRAIAAYVAALQPTRAPLDRYVSALREGDARGGEHLPAAAVRGLRAFIGEAGCVRCHHGPLLTDRSFHNIGLPSAIGAAAHDPGRSAGAQRVRGNPFRCGGDYSQDSDCLELRYLDASLPELVGAFKTPSLRNVAQTPPYMHTGQFATLAEVVEFYRALPDSVQLGRRASMLQPLPRSVSTADLVAFLRAL